MEPKPPRDGGEGEGPTHGARGYIDTTPGAIFEFTALFAPHPLHGAVVGCGGVIRPAPAF